MRWVPLLALLLAGCASGAADEAQAAKELAPKPASTDQVEKIKAQFPQGGAKPGRS